MALTARTLVILVSRGLTLTDALPSLMPLRLAMLILMVVNVSESSFTV